MRPYVHSFVYLFVLTICLIIEYPAHTILRSSHSFVRSRAHSLFTHDFASQLKACPREIRAFFIGCER